MIVALSGATKGKAMTYLVMVVLGNVRQPMNLACCDYEGPTVSCPTFPQCDCGYAEGRLKPHYPVPACIVWYEYGRCLNDGSIVLLEGRAERY